MTNEMELLRVFARGYAGGMKQLKLCFADDDHEGRT